MKMRKEEKQDGFTSELGLYLIVDLIEDYPDTLLFFILKLKKIIALILIIQTKPK